MHDVLAVADEAFAGSRTVAGARTPVFTAGPRPSSAAKAAAAVANELASWWLVEVQNRTLGAEVFARNMMVFARDHDLVLTALAHRAIAQCFEQEGQFERALAFHRRAFQAAGDDPAVLNDYGAALGRARQYKKSIRILRRARELRPRDGRILANLGLSLAGADQTDEALRVLDEAVRHAPAYSRGWMARALARHRVGAQEDALADAKRAEELEPGNRWTWTLVAGCLVSLGLFREALDQLDGADRLGSLSPRELLMRAEAAFGADEVLSAAQAMRRFRDHPDVTTARVDPGIRAWEADLTARWESATKLSPSSTA